MESLGRVPLCRQVPSQTRNATNFLHLFEEETAQENCILTRNFCSGLTATVTEWWPTGSSARPCALSGSTRLRRNCRSSFSISSQKPAPTEETPLIFSEGGRGATHVGPFSRSAFLVNKRRTISLIGVMRRWHLGDSGNEENVFLLNWCLPLGPD